MDVLRDELFSVQLMSVPLPKGAITRRSENRGSRLAITVADFRNKIGTKRTFAISSFKSVFGA